MCAVFKQCLLCQERLPGGFSNENQFFLILLASPKHICSKPPDILNIMHMFKELQLQHNQPPVYSCSTASNFFLRQKTNAFPCSNMESKAQVCPCTKRIVKPLLCLRQSVEAGKLFWDCLNLEKMLSFWWICSCACYVGTCSCTCLSPKTFLPNLEFLLLTVVSHSQKELRFM